MINPVLSVDVDWVTNYNQSMELFSFLTKKFKTCNKIIFIDSHHNIIEHLSSDEDFIINVDHHHDIRYKHAHHEILHMGNWVEYLIRNNMLNHYIWVGNMDSNVEDEALNPIRGLETFKINHSLKSINSINFNKIIICKSFDFITQPQKDIGLSLVFEILKEISLNIFKEKTIVSNNPNPYKLKQI